MELVNEFTVKAPIGEAWAVLTDLERIAPCLPGAQLTEVEGDVYRGFVKIKVGPITAQFKGQATFVEKDEVNHKGTIKADGRDTGGKGNAAAFIHAQLTAVDAENTKCAITTDLTITGKVAQFGRGALADVSGKLIDQFAVNLETMVLAGDKPAETAPEASTANAPATAFDAPAPGTATSAPAAGAAASAPPGPSSEAPKVRKIEQRDVAPVDLLETAGAPLVKRLAPVALVALVLFFFLRRRRHRS
ncbi:MAG: SRPBCC family protein [Acidimicrobiia bacterium]